MPHSYTSCVMHCVFSTKDRHKTMSPQFQERLWPYVGGIARKNAIKALEVGGVEDHMHLLLSLPATMGVAKAMQLLKGGSSKWVHDNFPRLRAFAWQEGYGAFSIGKSQMADTVDYIRSQERHHRRITFQEEFLAFLKKHEIEYDER